MTGRKDKIMNSQKGIIEFDQGWKQIEEGFDKVKSILDDHKQSSSFSSEEYMKLYTTIYNMCSQRGHNNHSAELYKGYGNLIKAYVKNTVVPSLEEKHDDFLLRQIAMRWSHHKIMVRWLCRFFHYLDRFHVPQRCLTPLKEVGWVPFRHLAYNNFKRKAASAGIAQINREREGEQIDRALLKNVVDFFIEIGMEDMKPYQRDFEAPMLVDTGDYYSRKSSAWIVEDSCPDFMAKADECLKREKERAAAYLHSSSEEKVLQKVEQALLVHHCSQLLEKEHSGMRALLRDNRIEHLSTMYRLYNRITGRLDPVAKQFGQHIADEGTALVHQAEQESASNSDNANHYHVLVTKIIHLHHRYTGFVLGCFMSHSAFHRALKEAFDVFCNKSVAGVSTAEILAAFFDNVLKKKADEEALEETLDEAVKLLAYVHNKDLFSEFYRKKLAWRLLFDRSGSGGGGEDLERCVLTKLKQQYGCHLTSKMEGMITDLTLSRDHQTGFEEFLRANPSASPGIDLTVKVLTTGFWPTYRSLDLNLPAEMLNCVQVFKDYYGSIKKHRKLTWFYSLGSCNVVGNFDARSIEMVVSTNQAAALMLFNDANGLSYSEIKAQLGASEEDVKRLLNSLSCAKYKILSKSPANAKAISDGDVFEFNSKFTDRMRKIRVPLPPVNDRKKVSEEVEKDRKYTIDAAIVRIMKARKSLGHQQLVMECVEQLSKMFKPDIKAVKKRIEDLIVRDYLERDTQNPNLFRYLA